MKRIITQTLSIALLVSAFSPVFAGVEDLKKQLASKGLNPGVQPKTRPRRSAAPAVERPTTVGSEAQLAGLQLASVINGAGPELTQKLAERKKASETGEGSVTQSTNSDSKFERPKRTQTRRPRRRRKKQESQSYWSLLNSYKYHIAATVVGTYALYKGYKWLNS